jgi:perosamine synthetase
MSKSYIPLHAPIIKGNEFKYVNDCLKTGWVSTAGKYVNLFEEKIKKYTRAKYAIACTSGTSALHISLLLSGVDSKSEVIVPTLSFIAPINAIDYCNARPIFMDVDDDYSLDVKKTIEFIKNNTYFKNNKTINKKTNKHIKAIIVVHVYGRSVNFEELYLVCKNRKIKIVEDAAEGMGNFFLKGKFKKKHVGTLGDFGCLSFNGNKIITSGGGGMILTNNINYAKKAKYLTTQSKNDGIFFVHNEIGFNYRLTNVQAAIGLAQLEKINQYIKVKKKIYSNYLNFFSKKKKLNFKKIPNFASSNYWLNIVEFKKFYKKSDLKKIISKMKKHNIEVRPTWHLNHMQKQFNKSETYKIENANRLANKIICLPSSVNLSKKDIKRICSIIDG